MYPFFILTKIKTELVNEKSSMPECLQQGWLLIQIRSVSKL